MFGFGPVLNAVLFRQYSFVLDPGEVQFRAGECHVLLVTVLIHSNHKYAPVVNSPDKMLHALWCSGCSGRPIIGGQSVSTKLLVGWKFLCFLPPFLQHLFPCVRCRGGSASG